MKKNKLTIIILNHNTKEILSNCLDSIKKYLNESDIKIIVSDNNSSDGSVEMLTKKYQWVKVLSGPNISFSNGNNRARKITNSEYVLFLNSDTLINKNVIKKTLDYMDKNSNVGALTCKLVLENGKVDKDARRRFPTPWISFNRLFLNNGKVYWYEDIDEDKIHEVDAIEGAFFLTRKYILDKVNWFDENYIFDGEDLDLSYQIKKLGYKIVYFPKVYITHLKAVSKNKSELTLKRKMEGVDSMLYFYKKNLWKNYPILFNYFVVIGIKFLKLIRYLKIKYL